MTPKFIVIIVDLLPPYTVLFPHPQTMSDSLRCAPLLFRHRRKTATHSFPYYGNVSPYSKQVLNEYCAVPAQLLHQVNPYRLIHLVN